MTILEHALAHARNGRKLFPCAPNRKFPPIMDNPYEAMTTDEKQIRAWWEDNPNYNICLPGGYEAEPGKFYGWIDVDGEVGAQSYELLDLIHAIPETYMQKSPRGRHILLKFPRAIKNSASALAENIDTRGFHGYVIGSGSHTETGDYVILCDAPVADAPATLVEVCCEATAPAQHPQGSKIPVNEELAEKRAIQYLDSQLPVPEGQRNAKAYAAACMCRDFGVNQSRASQIMGGHFQSTPPLEIPEIEACVASAYKHGQNMQGSKSPEAVFTKIEPEPETPGAPKPKNPLEAMNDEYALTMAGGGVQILWFTDNVYGQKQTKHLSVDAFKVSVANRTVQFGESRVPMSKAWLTWPGRRSYKDIIFEPNFDHPDFYNKWQGFTCKPLAEPATPEAEKALKLFKDHVLLNICHGNEEHARWVTGWLAHIFQKPQDKVRTALAVRGEKGTGKSILFSIIGKLLGEHFMSTAKKSRLTGHFNAHLEGKLLMVLEEAFWSGDKAADGILKDLITGDHHEIERKGKDVYAVKNLCRTVILGNEEWVVPATDKERRYAVFDMAENNRGDSEFFGYMAENMDLRLLLKYFMDFDLSTVNVNVAPSTTGLVKQKEETHDPLTKWWRSCLSSGDIQGRGVGGWPEHIQKEHFREAYTQEMDMQNIGGRRADEIKMGKFLKKMAPSIKNERKLIGDQRLKLYMLPTLAQARKEYEAAIGHEIVWEEIDEDE